MAKKEMLLSIIVPIYKVEVYLTKCIDSILKQTYPWLEIILVNDGSPDRCGEICDEYLKKDKRIRVLHKENGGVSHAQNCGFQYSTGDYIAYVDGDDYVYNESSFLAFMNEAEKTHADIIMGNSYKDISGKLVPMPPHGFDAKTDTSSVDFRFKGFYSRGHLAYVWGKIYKRSFLIKHSLVMKPFIYSQDKLFNVECYINQPKYSFIEDTVYVYRWNLMSISHQYKNDFTKMWLEISEEMYCDMQRIKNGVQYFDILAFNLFFAIFFSSKQEYIASGCQLEAVKSEFIKYESHDLTKRFMKDMVKGKYIRDTSSVMWKGMMWSFSLVFTLKLYGILSLGIKYLIDWDIDGRLSSSGKHRVNKTLYARKKYEK